MILIEGIFLPIACNSATLFTICNLRKGVLYSSFPMSGLNTKDYTFDPGVVIDVVPDRCGCNKWFHRDQCGLSERTPRVVTIPWKIPGDLPFELHSHTTLCHIETPLDHKPYTSIEADLDLRQPIERFPQEIITQISKSLTVEEQIDFGLSSTTIRHQVPSEIYRKIDVFPRRTRGAYREYTKHLGKLWYQCASGTARDDLSSHVIGQLLMALSGWMTRRIGQNRESFSMAQFIRLHSLVERSLSMQETATRFVIYLHRHGGPFTPCQEWRACCMWVPYENHDTYSNEFAYVQMRELMISYELFADSDDEPAHPLDKCLNYVICTVIQHADRSKNHLEVAVDELERALVEFKNFGSGFRKSRFLSY